MTGLNHKPASDYQVVVIGHGPSGAIAASLLGDQNIRTLAVDRHRDVYDKPRAIALDHEILRILDNIGVADEVMPFIAPFPASRHYGAQGQLIRQIDMVAEPYPLAYTPTMVFTQPPVEEALRAHASSYSCVDVELGTELISFEQTSDQVTLQLRDEAGMTRSVTADYVIACDGASSSVRQSLGIALHDLVFDEPWLVVDLKVNAAGLAKLPETAAQFCDPARPTSYIVGPENHRRFEIALMPGEDPRAMESEEQVWRLLARWITPDDGTLWRAASYRFHALVAEEWRKGRVFIAGDAAHQQPPFLGQGMCQGVRDVSNLIWKLDRVIAGTSSDSLLDSYGIERGQHVRELTSRIKEIGHVICERDPAAAALRDDRILALGGGKPLMITRQEIVPPLQVGLLSHEAHPLRGLLSPQPWIKSNGGSARLDTISGAGWRLLINDASGLDISALQSIFDDIGIAVIRIGNHAANNHALQEEHGVVASWLAKANASAAIIRPDHYVFGAAGASDALARLLDELKLRLR